MSGDRLKTTLVVLVVLFGVYWFWNDLPFGDWIRDKAGGRGPDSPELRAADLRGRIKKAQAFSLEVQSRLDAYKTRFQGEEAMVLDRAFLDRNGSMALSPLRADWYELRSELPEFLEKHRKYRELLRDAASDLSPAKVNENWTLPERANSWNQALDETITARIQKLPQFMELANQLRYPR
jgi:hypothetical protein